jgi:hypothetical protein
VLADPLPFGELTFALLARMPAGLASRRVHCLRASVNLTLPRRSLKMKRPADIPPRAIHETHYFEFDFNFGRDFLLSRRPIFGLPVCPADPLLLNLVNELNSEQALYALRIQVQTVTGDWVTPRELLRNLPDKHGNPG